MGAAQNLASKELVSMGDIRLIICVNLEWMHSLNLAVQAPQTLSQKGLLLSEGKRGEHISKFIMFLYSRF